MCKYNFVKSIKYLVIVFLFQLSFQVQSEELKIIANSSLTGKGSLGEWVVKEFEKNNPNVKIRLIPKADYNSLLEGFKNKGQNNKYDLIWGLDKINNEKAIYEKIIHKSFLYNIGPHALMVDTQHVDVKKIPNTWNEVAVRYKGKIILQDPRSSSAALGWLRVVYEKKLITDKDEKKLRHRVYPSWSSSYEAFVRGEAPVIWSYLSSQSYHQCVEKNERYKAVRLAEGYPQQEEYIGLISYSNIALKFANYILSHEVQQEIPLKNFMYPVNPNVSLPECFIPMDQNSTWKNSAHDTVIDFKLLNQWIEKWIL